MRRASARSQTQTPLGAVLLIVACLLLQATAAASSDTEGQLFAYVTSSQLVLMDGNRTVLSASIDGSNLLAPGVLWTDDGRYLAALVGTIFDPQNPEIKAGQDITVIDTATSAVRSISCRQCTSLAAVGDGKLMATQLSSLSLSGSVSYGLLFDLNSDQPAERFDWTDKALGSAYFAAAAPGSALLASTGRSGKQYSTVSLDGVIDELARPFDIRRLIGRDDDPQDFFKGAGFSVHSLTGLESNTYVVSSGYRYRSGDCPQQTDALMIDGSSGDMLDLDPLRVAGSYTDATVQSVQLRNIWWSAREQTLHAIIAVTKCSPRLEQTVPPTEWKLINGEWVQVSDLQIVAVAESSSGWRMVVPFNGRDMDSGPLMVTHHGRSTTLAEGVRQVIAPPLVGVPNLDATNSPCLFGAKADAGQGSGDMDGDGLTDRVELYQCAALTADSTSRLALDVTLGTGRKFSQVIRTDSTDPGLLGLTDVNGDRRDDLVVVPIHGAHTQFISLLQYDVTTGTMRPIPGDYDAEGLYIDSSYSSLAGLACTRQGDRAQLVYTTLSLSGNNLPANFSGEVVTYSAAANGYMEKTKFETVAYAATATHNGLPLAPENIVGMAGVHCGNIDNFAHVPK